MMGRPWFPLYAADLLVDAKVAQLSDPQFRMLVRVWCRCCLDGSVPAEAKAFAKVMGCRENVARLTLQWLVNFISIDPSMGGRLISERMHREAQRYEAKVEKLRANGLKGGRGHKAKASEMLVEPQPQPQPQKEKEQKTPRKRGPAKPEPTSLEEILKGGKGTPYWEAYWKLVGTFGGQSKNPAPRTTAALYMTATVGYHPEHIQGKAEDLRAQTSEAKFMPQLAKWLEGCGYATPDLPKPPKTNGANHARSPQHRAEVDAAYIETLHRKPSAAPLEAFTPDPELHSLFESSPT
jgi:hypothetical protein